MQTLGLGFTWEQLSPGQRFRTLNRTLTETDLVLFTGVTGMLETIFIDRTFGGEKGAIQGQFVPAALTWRDRGGVRPAHLERQSRHRRFQDRGEEPAGRGGDELRSNPNAGGWLPRSGQGGNSVIAEQTCAG